MKMKKLLVLALCLVTIASISVVATLAYFTDTATVTNTFTVGKVGIKLDEVVVDDDGKALASGARTETGNSEKYQLIPGRTLDKDPTITIDGDSEDCYVVAKVEVNKAAKLQELLPANIGNNDTYIGFAGFVTGGVVEGGKLETAHTTNTTTMTGWTNTVVPVGKVFLTQTPNVTDGNYTFYIYFEDAQQANDKLVLFENIIVPTAWTNDDIAALTNMEIKVTAYAIQAEGFANVYAAYDAYTAQNN